MMRTRGDRLLLGLLRAGWRRACVLLLASVVGTGTVLAMPAVVATAVDARINGAGPESALFVLVALLVLRVLADVVGQQVAAVGTAHTTRVLRRRLLRHVLDLGPGRTHIAAGDVVSRLVGNTSQAAAIAPTVTRSASALLTSAGGVVALALLDYRLALVFLAALPIGTVIIRTFVVRTSTLTARYQGTLGDVSGRLVDALGGVRTIRASATTDREVDRILRPARDLGEVGRGMWTAHGRVSWQGGLYAATVQLTVLATAGFGVTAGRITAGQLLAAIAYVTMGLGLLGQAEILAALARVRIGADRLAVVMAEPVPTASPDFVALPSGPADLMLHDVTVRLGDRTVLDRVTLHVPAGRSVAIAGASAAGKSTLAAVAGRLLAPDGGTVLLDGVPVDRIDPALLRRQVTYAFERPALLGDTVAGAIAFGVTDPDRSTVERSARAAAADGFIRRLPAGYDTPLDRAPMSGGEVQRLGLARALARPGRLLILDDATSSLDTVTEQTVSTALIGSLSGRTCLVVAHRPATVARCDLVAWLDQGRIRAVAPHDALWRDPDYRAMFQPAEPVCVP